MAVKDKVIFVPRGPRGLTGPQGPVGDPSLETARLDVLEMTTGFANTVFVSALGDDANPGTLAEPYRTIQGAIMNATSTRSLNVRLLTDIDWDYRLDLSAFYGSINFQGRTSDNSGSEERTIAVVDATNNANRSGGIVLNNAFTNITFNQIHIELNTTKGAGVIEVPSAKIAGIYLSNTRLSRIGSGSCDLLFLSTGFATIGSFAFTLEASGAGYFVSGVGAGADPNDRVNVLGSTVTSG